MTQPVITPEEIERLQQPFNPEEYEAREGVTGGNNVRWFIYVTKEAIHRRLTDVFGYEWQTKKESETMHGNSVTVCRSITIRGIYRDFTGSASGGDEKLIKSADTDAYKRVAFMWGIGMELQSCPEIWTAYDYVTEEKNNRKKTDWNKRAVREREALDKFNKWLTGEVRKQSSPTPTANGKMAQNGSRRVQWANKGAIAEMVANFQEKTNTNASVSDLAVLAGINKPSNYKAWNDKYATDGDAKKVIWQAYQDGALTRIQDAEQSTMAELEEIAAKAESPKA